METSHDTERHKLHQGNLDQLFSIVNGLRVDAASFITTKASITFFLGTLLTITGTFLTQSYIQSQTFLEIRKQDQAELTIYKIEMQKAVTKHGEEIIQLTGEHGQLKRSQDLLMDRVFYKSSGLPPGDLNPSVR